MKKFISAKMINLADPRIGSKIIFKTDDFFAAAHRILKTDIPVFKDGLFDKHGKWMDGWETRRRRSKGYDYLVLKFEVNNEVNKEFFLTPKEKYEKLKEINPKIEKLKTDLKLDF